MNEYFVIRPITQKWSKITKIFERNNKIFPKITGKDSESDFSLFQDSNFYGRRSKFKYAEITITQFFLLLRNFMMNILYTF